jgi:ribosome-binding protein aMBF1 (putative translation factor)
LSIVGKKWSKEKLAARLEEGASVLKAVYRYTSL